MDRYEVIESKVWQRDDGMRASIYGSVPYVNEQEKARWQVVTVGWTIRDNRLNSVGIGRVPFAAREEAQAWVNQKTDSRKKA